MSRDFLLILRPIAEVTLYEGIIALTRMKPKGIIALTGKGNPKA